jgi:hypothetical protein
MSVIMKLHNMDPNRFSENNREYLKNYEKANEVSEQKTIIEKKIKNEEKRLQENIDFLQGMHKVNNSKSTRGFLAILLFTGLAIGAGYFVFTFLVAASIVSVPIFVALCFVSGAHFTKGIGHSPYELDEQKGICSVNKKIISELKAELKRLDAPDSAEKVKESVSEKREKRKVSFFLDQSVIGQEDKESPDTNNSNQSYAFRIK